MQNFDFSRYDKKWKYLAKDEDGRRSLFTRKPMRFKSWWQPADLKEHEYLRVDRIDTEGWENSLQEQEKDLQD